MLQGRLAEVEEDKNRLNSRNKALEVRVRETEQDATTARAEAHRNMDQLTQLDQDMRATEASLASVQDQLHQALQVGCKPAALRHASGSQLAEIFSHRHTGSQVVCSEAVQLLLQQGHQGAVCLLPSACAQSSQCMVTLNFVTLVISFWWSSSCS